MAAVEVGAKDGAVGVRPVDPLAVDRQPGWESGLLDEALLRPAAVESGSTDRLRVGVGPVDVLGIDCDVDHVGALGACDLDEAFLQTAAVEVGAADAVVVRPVDVVGIHRDVVCAVVDEAPLEAAAVEIGALDRARILFAQ